MIKFLEGKKISKMLSGLVLHYRNVFYFFPEDSILIFKLD